MHYVVEGLALVLVGFIVYLWQKDKNKELYRLYKWEQDIFDRIGSDNIEQYALTNRIKYEIANPPAAPTAPKEEEKTPPEFVQRRR